MFANYKINITSDNKVKLVEFQIIQKNTIKKIVLQQNF